MQISRRSFLSIISAAPVIPQLVTSSNAGISAASLAADIAERRISALYATDQAIARIEKLDPHINAVVVRDFDRARDAARTADAAIGAGERKPLFGVPVTVKESFDVEGLPTTWGIPSASPIVAARDAAAVEALKAAGAVILGKTNLHFQTGIYQGARVPLLLHDWQSYNPVYGTTNNPWDRQRTPGGSSGGSAAALAAGYVTLELGSDVGGSIRAPAHFCGVYGHKPTSGVVSGQGHVPPGASGPPRHPGLIDMAVYGPLARTPDDLELALEILKVEGARLEPVRRTRLRDFRIFVIDTHPLMPASDDIKLMLNERAAALAHIGARVIRRSPFLPDLAQSARLYMRAISAFDAMGWGATKRGPLEAAASRLSPRDTSLVAERLRGAVLSDTEIEGILAARREIQSQWQGFFKNFDVVMCPIMPTTAFHHNQSAEQEARTISVDGVEHPYLNQLFWPGIATFSGLPATACPLGLAPSGLPVGMQIIGPWMGDRTTIRFAAEMEQVFGPAPRLPA